MLINIWCGNLGEAVTPSAPLVPPPMKWVLKLKLSKLVYTQLVVHVHTCPQPTCILPQSILYSSKLSREIYCTHRNFSEIILYLCDYVFFHEYHKILALENLELYGIHYCMCLVCAVKAELTHYHVLHTEKDSRPL